MLFETSKSEYTGAKVCFTNDQSLKLISWKSM